MKNKPDSKTLIKNTIPNTPVLVISKTWCPYCRQLKTLFKQLRVKDVVYIELDKRKDGPKVQSELTSAYGQRTVPMVFVGGKLVGGVDKTEALHRQGKLLPRLAEAGAIVGGDMQIEHHHHRHLARVKGEKGGKGKNKLWAKKMGGGKSKKKGLVRLPSEEDEESATSSSSISESSSIPSHRGSSSDDTESSSSGDLWSEGDSGGTSSGYDSSVEGSSWGSESAPRPGQRLTSGDTQDKRVAREAAKHYALMRSRGTGGGGRGVAGHDGRDSPGLVQMRKEKAKCRCSVQ